MKKLLAIRLMLFPMIAWGQMPNDLLMEEDVVI